MEINPQPLVREFHETYGQPVGDWTAPKVDPFRVRLRFGLIAEEYTEVFEELFIVEDDDDPESIDDFEIREDIDIAKLSKELADLVYVAYGWAVEMGIDLGAVIQEVHNSNLSKLDDDGRPIFRADGKVLKGENYYEPDIAGVIAEQGKLPGYIPVWAL